MAEIFHNRVNRRDFIKVGLAAAGAFATLGAGKNFGSDKPKDTVTRWAFLADTHIAEDVNDSYRGLYPYKNLQEVLSEVAADLPDGVLIAGDLARLEGKLNDYVSLKRLLEPISGRTPVVMALGNHDDRVNFLKVFTETAGQKQPVQNKHVLVFNRPPVRLVILDSLLFVNKVPGLLGKAQRQWLEQYLKDVDDRPTILCVHHTLGDGDGELLDVPRLFRVIAPIRKVKAIVYGHSHEYGFSELEGIHLINIPAVGYNFNDSEPVGWVEAQLTAKGGDFTLHAVAGNTQNDGKTERLTWRT
jgi:Icc protein